MLMNDKKSPPPELAACEVGPVRPVGHVGQVGLVRRRYDCGSGLRGKASIMEPGVEL